MNSGRVAPKTPIVSHSGIPTHPHELPPTRSETNIHRTLVGIVAWNRIPSRPLSRRIRDVASRRKIQNRSSALIDKIGLTGRSSEFHCIEILIHKWNDDGLAALSENLVSALIELSAPHRHLLSHRNLLPLENLPSSGGRSSALIHIPRVVIIALIISVALITVVALIVSIALWSRLSHRRSGGNGSVIVTRTATGKATKTDHDSRCCERISQFSILHGVSS